MIAALFVIFVACISAFIITSPLRSSATLNEAKIDKLNKKTFDGNNPIKSKFRSMRDKKPRHCPLSVPGVLGMLKRKNSQDAESDSDEENPHNVERSFSSPSTHLKADSENWRGELHEKQNLELQAFSTVSEVQSIPSKNEVSNNSKSVPSTTFRGRVANQL